MFQFSFSVRDFVRSVWALVFASSASFIVAMTAIVTDVAKACGANITASKASVVALVVGFIAAIGTGIKNLVLKDGTKLKG